jgi:hypothetical protein
VNNDGYDDVILGVSGSIYLPGWAYVYYGGQLMDNTEDITLTGECEADEFGASVSIVGDTNGDGITEWIVGAPGAGETRSGKLSVSAFRAPDARLARRSVSAEGGPILST